MTPEAQRIAIAEACGWKKLPVPKDIGFGESAPSQCWYFAHQLPDYLSDLNAMHEAEKVLKPEQLMTYAKHLGYAVWHYHKYMATAAQRAESFLRTLNLWKP